MQQIIRERHEICIRTYRNSPRYLKTKKEVIQANLSNFDVLPFQPGEKRWGDISNERFCEEIYRIYDEIVHIVQNIFNVPSGKAGKYFITELTYWIKQLNSNTDLKFHRLESVHGPTHSNPTKTISIVKK